MRLRAISFILVCLLAVAALLASNRARPLVVESNSSGPWLFSQADYSICTTVQPPPLRPRPHGVNLYPRRSDTA